MADRFIVGVAPIDYGPVFLLMPFGFHLAMDTLPSRELRKRCPTLSGQRGIAPAFGYDAPHPGARGTSTLLNNVLLSTHYEPVRLPTGAVPAVIYSPKALVPRSDRGTTPSGLPGPSADLSPRAIPYHPEKSRRCLRPLLRGEYQVSSTLED